MTFGFKQQLASTALNAAFAATLTQDASNNPAKASLGSTDAPLSQRMTRLLNPVDDFGADPTGTTVSTSALQACFSAGAPIDLAGGTYLIDGPITLPAKGVRVNGRGALIRTNNLTADFFVFAANAYGWVFDDFNLSATAQKTAGWCFNGSAVIGRCHWHKVGMQDQDDWSQNGSKLWGGILAVGADSLRIKSCMFWACKYAGIKAWNCNGIVLNGGNRFVLCGAYTNSGGSGAPGGGIWLAGGNGGIWIDQSDFACDTNLYIDNSGSGTVNAQVFLGPAFCSDICASNGVYVGPNSCSRLMVSAGGWFCSAGDVNPSNTPAGYSVNPTGEHCGILVDTNNTGFVLVINGATIGNSAGSGLVINGGRLIMTGCEVWGNAGKGVWMPEGDDSLFIQGDIVGSTFYGNGTCDVELPGETAAQYKLVGNTFQSTVPVLGVTDARPNQIIHDNIGFITAASGGSQIPAGNLSVVIPHTLDVAPDCILTTLNSNVNAILNYTSVTTSTFTIEMAGTLGSDAGFAWRATYGYGS